MFNNAMLSGFEVYPRWVPLKDTSTPRARLMRLAMLTVLFLNTQTWSFPKLQLQRKQKKSVLTTFFGVSSMHRHGINIPLKK